MAKYLVETHYNCTFKVSHYLDEINDSELKKLEKRDDGKFEILDIKLENRKTKNLESKKIVSKKEEPKKIDVVLQNSSKNLPKKKVKILVPIVWRFHQVKVSLMSVNINFKKYFNLKL